MAFVGLEAFPGDHEGQQSGRNASKTARGHERAGARQTRTRRHRDPVTPRLWTVRGSGLQNGFALDLDLDLLADHHAATLERDVPAQVPLGTVDLGAGAEAEHVL